MVNSTFLEQQGFYVTLSNGQTDHFFIDSFTDPWIPSDDKEVILIQPGFGRSGVFWYHWVPVLARDYVVIRRDLRGHGKSSYPKRLSPWSEEPGVYENHYLYNIETICAEIVDFLDRLGIKTVHFLGESTSGQLGHALAARHPDRISSLITCSSPTYLPDDKQRFLAMNQASWPEALISLDSRGWAAALAQQPGTAPREDPSYQEWWLSEVAKSSADGLAGYAAFLSQLNTRRFLPEISCPVLILAPVNSKAVPMEESEYAANHIPGAELKVIESQGHEIYVESAQACQEVVLQHLSRFRR
ncbi:Alpha/beta-hydrolase [Pleurostoma richardsiae]|uniref:Alpha/beta-hydrolase n=1 Tax=Pleurostoma richardsiae TaxID=41990 RepID=A0AA38RD95_9PEZI|nr:Alpha/beta-hydrolase [Pleurostoma richardsiae]